MTPRTRWLTRRRNREGERDHPADPDARRVRPEVAGHDDHGEGRLPGALRPGRLHELRLSPVRSSVRKTCAFDVVGVRRSGARSARTGVPGVVIEEISDYITHASTLTGGTGEGTTVKILGQADRDPWRVDTRRLAKRWPTGPGRPGGDVKILFDVRGETIDVGFREPPSALRDHRSCHRITSS